MLRMTSLATAALLSCVSIAAQDPSKDVQDGPRFDVASVKPRDIRERYPVMQLVPRVRIVDMPLRSIVAAAYGIDSRLRRFRLAGGDEGILDSRFDIEATAPDDAPPGRQLAMLRALLADRFGLRTRNESRLLSIYALRVERAGRLGPQLRPSPHNCREFFVAGGRAGQADVPRDNQGNLLCFVTPNFEQMRAGAMTIRNTGTIADLILELQPHVDRVVVDETALSGNYEWTTTVAMQLTNTQSTHPSIFSAIPRDLGLKLHSERGLVDVLVIDAVTMPSPN